MLTMEQAVALAVQHHPDAVADFSVRAAAVLPDPEFRFSTNSFAIDPDLGNMRNSASIRWRPPRPGEISFRRLVENRLAAAVRHAFRRTVLAGQRAQTAERTATVRRKMLDVIRRQIAAGLKESIDSDIAELALAAAEKQKLVRTVGPAAPRGARNQRYPWLTYVQVSRRLTTQQDAGFWSVQLGVNLPLFRSAAPAETRIAEARVTRCQREREALRGHRRAEAEETVEWMRVAAAELTHLDGIRRGPAARAVAHLQEALAAGRTDRLELLNAETRVLSLQDRWLQSRLEYAALEARLELAAGSP